MNKTDKTNDTHFYAANAFMWATTNESRDLPDLLKTMAADKVVYGLWYLPVPYTTNYEIEWYAPKVEGAVYLGTFGEKKKRATKKGEKK